MKLLIFKSFSRKLLVKYSFVSKMFRIFDANIVMTNNLNMNILRILGLASALSVGSGTSLLAQALKLNELGYFEKQGVNVLVFSNDFNGGFNDEKNSGIEIIHHGVRTVQGGAVRLNKTPEQWDLVPKSVKRTVNEKDNSIEVTLRYDDYDFDSRVLYKEKGE